MELKWECRAFDQVPVRMLYRLIALRQAVFVVEQECAYQDCDGRDTDAFHLYALKGTEPVAYARLLPPGGSYREMSIGRILTAASVRNRGLGKLLMKKAIEESESRFGAGPIRIGAQAYLVDFYRAFSFIPEDAYMEDGIPHVHMIRNTPG